MKASCRLNDRQTNRVDHSVVNLYALLDEEWQRHLWAINPYVIFSGRPAAAVPPITGRSSAHTMKRNQFSATLFHIIYGSLDVDSSVQLFSLSRNKWAHIHMWMSESHSIDIKGKINSMFRVEAQKPPNMTPHLISKVLCFFLSFFFFSYSLVGFPAVLCSPSL